MLRNRQQANKMKFYDFSVLPVFFNFCAQLIHVYSCIVIDGEGRGEEAGFVNRVIEAVE